MREFLAPQLRTVAHIHQLRPDGERVAPLRHSTGEHGLHTHVSAGLTRIDLFAFVAEGRAPRHDTQMRQLGQTIDQALANAIAQIFGVRIAAGIVEW